VELTKHGPGRTESPSPKFGSTSPYLESSLPPPNLPLNNWTDTSRCSLLKYSHVKNSGSFPSESDQDFASSELPPSVQSSNSLSEDSWTRKHLVEGGIREFPAQSFGNRPTEEGREGALGMNEEGFKNILRNKKFENPAGSFARRSKIVSDANAGEAFYEASSSKMNKNAADEEVILVNAITLMASEESTL